MVFIHLGVQFRSASRLLDGIHVCGDPTRTYAGPPSRVPSKVVHHRLGTMQYSSVDQNEYLPVLVAQFVQIPDERGGVEFFTYPEHLRLVVGDGPGTRRPSYSYGVRDVDLLPDGGPQLVLMCLLRHALSRICHAYCILICPNHQRAIYF